MTTKFKYSALLGQLHAAPAVVHSIVYDNWRNHSTPLTEDEFAADLEKRLVTTLHRSFFRRAQEYRGNGDGPAFVFSLVEENQELRGLLGAYRYLHKKDFDLDAQLKTYDFNHARAVWEFAQRPV